MLLNLTHIGQIALPVADVDRRDALPPPRRMPTPVSSRAEAARRVTSCA